MTTQGDEVPTRTSSVADGAGPKDEAAGAEPEASPPRAAGRHRFRYTLPGAWVALVFACLAFTPSLLPRSAVLQGVRHQRRHRLRGLGGRGLDLAGVCRP
jgi:uncharacterized membrane protein